MRRATEILAAVLVAAGCSGRSAAPQRYTIRIGSAAAVVEIADTAEERARGLSGRRSLAADEGMLFVFPEPRRVSFWMKDTFVALSIAFITPGARIAEIQHMEPLSRRTHISKQPALMALEMPAGWFEKNGVAVGDGLVLPSALAGVRGR